MTYSQKEHSNIVWQGSYGGGAWTSDEAWGMNNILCTVIAKWILEMIIGYRY